MSSVSPRRRPARPVADAPLDTLLGDVEGLAKGWLLALVEQAPLQRVGAILSDELTRDGPRVCDAALRAMADDADLRRLRDGGALRPLVSRVGAMTGAAADGPAAVSAAVETLRAVLWVALHDELRGPLGGDPALVSDLSERLALVCEVVREAALTPGGAPGEPFPLELAAVPPRTAPPHRAPSAPPQSPPPAATAGSPSGAALELPLWRSALADEVRQAHGGPLALLLAELEDADRVIASASPERAQFAFSEFTGALREALRRQDILASEADGRAWVIARDTSRAGAQALGRRIAQGVGDAAPFGGAPLVATVGIALLGEDGLTADELIEAAEEARFDASARGIEVSRGLTD